MRDCDIMAENKSNRTQENGHSINTSLTETKNYDFDKNFSLLNGFIKKEKAETLGSILLRLMTHTK